MIEEEERGEAAAQLALADRAPGVPAAFGVTPVPAAVAVTAREDSGPPVRPTVLSPVPGAGSQVSDGRDAADGGVSAPSRLAASAALTGQARPQPVGAASWSALGAAAHSAAASAIPYRQAVLAAFTYDVPADSPRELIVKRNAMQDNGPLATRILVTARHARAAPQASRDSLLRATAPYNTSVVPDDDCPDAATWTLQQDLLFRVLILSQATTIRHVDSLHRHREYQPRLTRLSCLEFECVRRDALLSRSASPLGFDMVNAPSLQLLHHAVGSVGADLPERLSLTRLLRPPPGSEHAASRKEYIDQLCAAARDTGSLLGFSLSQAKGVSKTRGNISSARVLNEVERIERSPESCSALPSPASAAGHSAPIGLFLTTFDAEESRAARGHHARAVEVMEDVVVAVAQSGLVRLTDQPDHATPDAHAQLDFNSVWAAPLSGFGSSKVQLYGKTIVTDTALHDEIADSAAVNYSTLSSRGMSVWVGCCPRDLMGRVAAADRPRLLERFHAMISTDGFSYAELLTLVLSTGTVPRVVFQLPGETVVTPSGMGAAHAVLGVGSQMLNLAINLSTSPSACDAALSFWEDYPAVLFNSSLATRTIFPGMWLKEMRRWPLRHPFWSEQIAAVTAVVDAARARCTSPQGVLIYTRRFDGAEDDARRFCMSEILPPGTKLDGYVPLHGDRHCCGVEILWLSINGMCVHCFYNGHSLMQSAGAAAAPHYPHMNAAGRRSGFEQPVLPHQLDRQMYRVANSAQRRAPTSPPPPPPPPPSPPPPPPVGSATSPARLDSGALIEPPSLWAQLGACAISLVSSIRLACCARPSVLASTACAHAPLSPAPAACGQRDLRPRAPAPLSLCLPPAAPPPPPSVPAPPTSSGPRRRGRSDASAQSVPPAQSMDEDPARHRPAKTRRTAAPAASPTVTMAAVGHSPGAAPLVAASSAAAAAAAEAPLPLAGAAAVAPSVPQLQRPRRKAAEASQARTQQQVNDGGLSGASDSDHRDGSPPRSQSDDDVDERKGASAQRQRRRKSGTRAGAGRKSSKAATREAHAQIAGHLRRQWPLALLMSTNKWMWQPMLQESAERNGWTQVEPVAQVRVGSILCSMPLATGVCRDQHNRFTLSSEMMNSTVALLQKKESAV